MEKEREENVLKKIWHHYINCVAQDLDEKNGVSADGWKKRAVTSLLGIFVRGVVKITSAPLIS